MGRWLAQRDGAVVATLAGADHRRMIDPQDRRPGCRRMAVITGIRGRNMGCGFARCSGAVVA